MIEKRSTGLADVDDLAPTETRRGVCGSESCAVWPKAVGLAAGVCAAAGVGAGLMYLFDPNRGKARRAVLRDQVGSGWRHGRSVFGNVAADLQNRAYGALAEMRGRIAPQTEPVSDQRLAARVHSSLGRITAHAHAIHVETKDGAVILGGPVLIDEVDRILRHVRAIPGVAHVDNRMEMHESAEGVPRLQGGRKRAPGSANLGALASFVGGALCGLYGFRR